MLAARAALLRQRLFLAQLWLNGGSGSAD